MNYYLFSSGIPSETAPLWGLSLWDKHVEAWWPSVVQSTWWTEQVLNWEGRGEERRGTTAIMAQLQSPGRKMLPAWGLLHHC